MAFDHVVVWAQFRFKFAQSEGTTIVFVYTYMEISNICNREDKATSPLLDKMNEWDLSGLYVKQYTQIPC